MSLQEEAAGTVPPTQVHATDVRSMEVDTSVWGEGLLAEVTRATVTGLPAECRRATVTAADGWDTSSMAEARKCATERSEPLLPIRVELSRVVIGPVDIPGTPGCGRCAQTRRSLASTRAGEQRAVQDRYGEQLATRPSPLLTRLAANSVAALVGDELRRLAADAVSARTYRAFLLVDLTDLQVARHSFLPDPLCPQCGDLPVDDELAASIVLTPQPKLAPDTHRTRLVFDEIDQLEDLYVDAEAGLIRTVQQSTMGGLVLAAAMLPIRSHAGAVEPGVGRTRSYRASQTIAILEALERYGGVEPGGKRTAVEASLADLGERALDPRVLGVHPLESYQDPSFHHRPFDPQEIYRWVWGYSFARQEPLLVPEAVAYYGTHRKAGTGRSFLYEISNGCALGSCLEEAILHGILEVAERDAFLMTWYARLPVPRIDLTGATDPNIPLVAAMIRAETGYEPRVFDTTMEHGVPSVWAMAVASQSTAADAPAMVCAAGSSLDPERAVLNALSELGPILVDLIRRYPDERVRARQMVHQPELVVSMQDHSTLYADPEAFSRLAFLGRGGLRTLEQMRSAVGTTFQEDDLTDDLRTVVQRFIDLGQDVVVVDQTSPEHRAGGFRCVKALIPGALPMTFGHRNRRTEGLSRLSSVPLRLALAERRLQPVDLNPHPHPFP